MYPRGSGGIILTAGFPDGRVETAAIREKNMTQIRNIDGSAARAKTRVIIRRKSIGRYIRCIIYTIYILWLKEETKNLTIDGSARKISSPSPTLLV